MIMFENSDSGATIGPQREPTPTKTQINISDSAIRVVMPHDATMKACPQYGSSTP